MAEKDYMELYMYLHSIVHGIATFSLNAADAGKMRFIVDEIEVTPDINIGGRCLVRVPHRIADSYYLLTQIRTPLPAKTTIGLGDGAIPVPERSEKPPMSPAEKVNASLAELKQTNAQHQGFKIQKARTIGKQLEDSIAKMDADTLDSISFETDSTIHPPLDKPV